jgi:hypothetical protein
MRTFKVKACGHGQMTAHPAMKESRVGATEPGACGHGGAERQQMGNTVTRPDGSREDIDATRVVIWDTGDWVQHGGTGVFRTCDYVDRWPRPRLTAFATTAAGSVAFGLVPETLGGFVTWQRSLPSTKSTTWTIGFTRPSGRSSSGPLE